jgi:nitrile hydratase
MNGIHDMGGMHGFGSVVHTPNQQPDFEPWEARVEAIDSIVEEQGWFNIDEFRYGIERMPPAHYLRASYFERWLATIEYNLCQKGVVGDGEVEARIALLRREPSYQPLVPTALTPPSPEPRIEPEPPKQRFDVGDRVQVRNVHPTHHTRAPRYTRGKVGIVQLAHGPFIFPDTHAHGLGQNRQSVYNVRFDAAELWGADAEPNQTVSIDLWETYLEPAP